MPLTTALDIEPSPEVVAFTFTVENDGDEPIDIQLRSAKHADVAVVDDSGQEVWRWGEGQMFAQMMQPVSFDPGHIETYEFEWPDPDPGDYEAVATLNAMDDISVRETFTV